ncbi:hypothetical protein FPCIR_12226 [Fusarium pseudocircinatum]|uniref:Azaphilone pigments biosynthesis cluster protein L N-terminal domain-containing protein n=1 Tax=Fusarium pseudocircinatum TaxID=56676 RepID=A0A8H5NU81_9HYPO|nr:hypothetical protein FPCIR_12226 [Fusarium pseudocircinatum]
MNYGPEVISRLAAEISQLKSILQRLNEVSFVSIDENDKSQLNNLAKKCKDDLSALNSRLEYLDVATSYDRRGRLWRKLKLYFSEKDLDHIRHVVRGHVQHLTVRLNLIQVQQGSFTATQSTQILNLVQQLKQDISALQITNTATLTAEEESSFTSGRVTEVDDEEMDCPPDASLDESISRLMLLLEKKPCVMEPDDSEELLKDIERLLECIRNDAGPVESERTCRDCRPDVSKELKLMANIILSSPSMMINQTEATRFWRPAGEQLLISPERKRKAFETDDGVITVTTAKRRRKLPSRGENKEAQNETRRDFLAKLTYRSKSTKKMLSLSVHQAQLLFSSFTSILPSIVVCNIKPKDSPVFDIARNGSVQDLLKLIEGGEADIHDHDIYGWSLLHGLDIDEVASRPNQDNQITPSHLALMANVPASHYEALLHAGADITLNVRREDSAISWVFNQDAADNTIKLKQALRLSPFVYADSTASDNQNLIAILCITCHECVKSEPNQARQQIRLLVEHGYDVNSTFRGQTPLHLLFTKCSPWLEFLSEYMDIVPYLVKHGADIHFEDWEGFQPSDYAYGATCEACYLFCPSAKGDVWDAALTYLGYDILESRGYYPRKARYITGYTRGDFEKLWHGQEDKCPYWDDRLWPPSSEQSDTASTSRLPVRGKLCEHVATWKSEEDGWKLVPFSDGESEYDVSSSEDSDDGGILLQGGLEEVFSDASGVEIS